MKVRSFDLYKAEGRWVERFMRVGLWSVQKGAVAFYGAAGAWHRLRGAK